MVRMGKRKTERTRMMKVLVVGAGAQGGPCASILSRDEAISEIVLGDIDLDLANRVKAKVGGNKITTVRVDAGSVEDIQKAAEGADVIINLTLTAFNPNIMQAALKAGAHYVDTSFGEPSLMDICARDNILAQVIEKRPLLFENEFREAGLTALAGEYKKEVERLTRRREKLRRQLQRHFSMPVVERDYAEFEKIVDELDDLRRRLSEIKQG